jgi:hypothetical protein
MHWFDDILFPDVQVCSFRVEPSCEITQAQSKRVTTNAATKLWDIQPQ